MQSAIINYHLDEEKHWVDELECGHFQHVRHNPPWQNRRWVTSENGRLAKLGELLECSKCDQQLPLDDVPASE